MLTALGFGSDGIKEIADPRFGRGHPERIDQHQLAQPVRVAAGEFGRYPAAQGRPDQIDGVEPQRIQHVQAEKDRVFYGVEFVKTLTVGIAGQGRRGHGKRGGQGFVKGGKTGRLGQAVNIGQEAVEVEQRRAAAAPQELNRAATDTERLGR